MHEILKPGDAFTMSGVYKKNPHYHWWTPWWPKHLDELQVFEVLGGARKDK